MPESLSPELLQLRQRAEQFANSVLLPSQAELADGRADLAAVRGIVTRAAVDAGFFKMTQPKSFGGSEAGLLAMTVVRDTLASYNTGLGDYVFGLAPGVLAHCAEPLNSLYLQPLLNGTKRAGFAFTEPDDAPHYTRAVPSADGTYVVSGRKSYVTRGGDADFFNTMVEIEGQGRALLVIDAHAPGVIIERRFESLDGSHHVAFCFDSVRVPADRLA